MTTGEQTEDLILSLYKMEAVIQGKHEPDQEELEDLIYRLAKGRDFFNKRVKFLEELL